MYLIGDRLYIHRQLGDQHELRPAGHPRLKREKAGVTSHHLDDEHPVVARRRVAQLADALKGGVAGRVKADRAVGARHIVVYRAGNANHADAAVVELLGPAKRAVAADHHQRVDVALPQLGNPGVDPLRPHKGGAARGAKHRPAVKQYPADRAARQRDKVSLEQSLISAAYAYHLQTMI